MDCPNCKSNDIHSEHYEGDSLEQCNKCGYTIENNICTCEGSKKLYCVRNAEGHYWNNDWGWMEIPEGDEGEFTIFTKEETKIFNLPMGKGIRWEKL